MASDTPPAGRMACVRDCCTCSLRRSAQWSPGPAETVGSRTAGDYFLSKPSREHNTVKHHLQVRSPRKGSGIPASLLYFDIGSVTDRLSAKLHMDEHNAQGSAPVSTSTAKILCVRTLDSNMHKCILRLKQFCTPPPLRTSAQACLQR